MAAAAFTSSPGSSGARSLFACACAAVVARAGGAPGFKFDNPVLGPDHPDPSVLLTTAGHYFLVSTPGDADVRLFQSADLAGWARVGDAGLFNVSAAAGCSRGAANASARAPCPGWQPSWDSDDGAGCRRAGCCFDPHPNPDPRHSPWCYSASPGTPPGSSMQLVAHEPWHYCDIWSPVLSRLAVGFMLSLSARRFPRPQTPCPPLPFPYSGTIYQAYSRADIAGPYSGVELAGPAPGCAAASAPRSLGNATSGGCGPTGDCEAVLRLGPERFADGNESWLAFEWYTHEPPRSKAEAADSGEHISLTRLAPGDPRRVACLPGASGTRGRGRGGASSAPGTPAITGRSPTSAPGTFVVASPKDAWLLAQLRGYCARCGEMLSFCMGRGGTCMATNGHTFGVAEAPALFRRGGFVYLLGSASAWDSAYYSVFFIAAPDVPSLRRGTPGQQT